MMTLRPTCLSTPVAGTEQHLAFLLTASVCFLAQGSDTVEDRGCGFQ